MAATAAMLVVSWPQPQLTKCKYMTVALLGCVGPPAWALQSAISTAADNQRPKVFVSSSAVGYYGASQTSSFTEDSPAGGDYLAEICKGECHMRGRIAPAPSATCFERSCSSCLPGWVPLTRLCSLHHVLVPDHAGVCMLC